MTEHSRQRRLSILGVCVVATLLLLVAGRWWLRGPHIEKTRLRIATTGLQVGLVEAKNGYMHSLVLTNQNDEAVRIDRFLSSCGCAEVRPEMLTLNPGEPAAIQLRLDLMRYLRMSDEAIIPAAVTITPIVNGVSDPGWQVNMEVVRPDIYAEVDELEFGSVSSTTTDVECLETIRVVDTVRNLAVSTDFPFASAMRVVPQDQRNGYTTYRLGISLTATSRPFGPFSFTAKIARNGGDAPFAVPCRIGFDSGLRAEVDEMPPRIIHLGQPMKWSVSVFRMQDPIANADLRLVSSSDQCSLTISRPSSLQTGNAECQFECECVPHNAGDLRISLLATSELGEGVVATQPLEMRFYVLSETQATKGL